MTDDVRKAIRSTSIAGAVVAAITSPVPLLDELLLLPLYGGLARRIGRAHGLASASLPWRPLLKTAMAGLAARALVNVTVIAFPGVAAVANATSAVVLTQLYGRYVDEACGDPAAARAFSIKEVAAMLRQRAKPAT